MNRRRWLVGAGCLAGAMLGEWRASARQAMEAAGVKTLEYWTGVAGVLGRDEFFAAYHKFDQTPADLAAAQMREIDGLPREGVDADLLAFVARLGKLRETLAEAGKESRWYHGVLWRTPKKVVEARQEADAAREALKKLRVALAKRYNVAFPECPFPAW